MSILDRYILGRIFLLFLQNIFIRMMYNGHCTPIWIEDRVFNIIFERITVNFTIRFIHITRLDQSDDVIFSYGKTEIFYCYTLYILID
ncbi:unnamed protein product [Rhizophagus irregularis]|nr:unnamed protein product [Rhizophagus irregularis]